MFPVRAAFDLWWCVQSEQPVTLGDVSSQSKLWPMVMCPVGAACDLWCPELLHLIVFLLWRCLHCGVWTVQSCNVEWPLSWATLQTVATFSGAGSDEPSFSRDDNRLFSCAMMRATLIDRTVSIFYVCNCSNQSTAAVISRDAPSEG